MNVNFRTILTLAAMATTTTVGSANAASVFGTGITSMLYRNYESVFDSTGSQIVPVGPLAVGDTIVGILQIDSITPLQGPTYSASATDEVTAIYAQRVVAIVGSTAYFDKATLTTFRNGADSFSTGLTGNEMFAFYHQTGAADFNAGIPAATTLANSVSTATNGSLLLTLGYATDANPTTFAGDTGYFYSNLSVDNNGYPQFAAFGGLNVLQNPAGIVLGLGKIDDPAETFSTAAAAGGNGSGIFRVDMWLRSSGSLDLVAGNPTAFNAPWGFISTDSAEIDIRAVPLPPAACAGLIMLGAMGLGMVVRR